MRIREVSIAEGGGVLSFAERTRYVRATMLPSVSSILAGDPENNNFVRVNDPFAPTFHRDAASFHGMRLHYYLLNSARLLSVVYNACLSTNANVYYNFLNMR